MGTTTDAYLMYGYDLGCDDEWKIQGLGGEGEWEPDWLEDDDLVTSAEKQLLASVGFTEEWSRHNVGYFDRKKAAEWQIGVKIESHCSGEYPMYVLSAKRFKASRGDVTQIDPVEMQAVVEREDLNGKLVRACEALGIQPTQEKPAWVLCSYWG
jgi:hypothetical protein